MKKFIRIILLICCMLFLTACQSTVGNADEAKNDIAWEDVTTSSADTEVDADTEAR
jgi:outer membrane biogenesis lipoprotein LolB